MLLVFFDLGLVKMNLELVVDFLEKNIIINFVLVVEGVYIVVVFL